MSTEEDFASLVLEALRALRVLRFVVGARCLDTICVYEHSNDTVTGVGAGSSPWLFLYKAFI